MNGANILGALGGALIGHAIGMQMGMTAALLGSVIGAFAATIVIQCSVPSPMEDGTR